MKKNIEVLDCTLRDGDIITIWDFSQPCSGLYKINFFIGC